ncbi:trypsin-like serine protease [cf. Phormidesmis sp. LEGE 11477]|uniref:S1 family peptidase n=1 Tax=cf. Phormidesmis sp. LEGE 11477 TaxID=1828680 RepID=UPI0018821F13|nr:trypsin-like serine protease [cf. Phormidesmis sp. LEGE 11477]MBE9061960.1 trypsin-like serine protease [cf. Phormidesmis sp. LEGE 11477]
MIIRHDVDPALYLVSSAQFPAVFAVDSFQEEVLVTYDKIDELLKPSLVVSVQPEPEFYTRCDGMGMLIRSDWVLSAAHVAIELSTEAEIVIAHQTYLIKEIVLHPQFLDFDGTELAKNDIALMQLKAPVENVMPLPLYQQKEEAGKIATFVGRGDFGTGLIGPDQVNGKMRMATNRIEQSDDQWLVFSFDAPPNCTELEGISGPGDSGGPALIETQFGWAIAGISSGQKSFNLGEGRYGVWEYYTRVSSHIAWIKSITRS